MLLLLLIPLISISQTMEENILLIAWARFILILFVLI